MGEVVVERAATWTTEDGTTRPLTVATSFTVVDDLIGRIARHADLDSAWADSRVTEEDDVSARS